jgi:hypothetical protein
MKKESFNIRLEDSTCVIITNKKTNQYGCVIKKEDAKTITTRKYYQYKNSNYSYDLKWIPNYMIEKAILLLEDINS